MAMMIVPKAKNTFLEFVVEAPDEEGAQPQIWNSQTDSRAMGIFNCRDGAVALEEDSDEAEMPQPGQDAEAALPQALEAPAETAEAPTPPSADGDDSEKAEQQPAKPRPVLDMSFQVTVKNTFLELVEEDDEPQGKIMKASTSPAAALRCEGLLGGHGDPFAEGEAEHLMTRAATEPHGKEAAAARSNSSSKASTSQGSSMASWSQEEERARAEPRRGSPGASKGAAAKDEAAPSQSDGSDGLTTVMVRNLPNDYTRDMVIELLDTFGFAGKYDFVYYPSDFARNAGLGYAFVNMVTPQDAKRVRWTLEGFRHWSVPSGKVCSVGWSLPCQGLEANIERYRNSPVMHKSIGDQFKPVIFRDGQRLPYPKPTRKVRRPDTRKSAC